MLSTMFWRPVRAAPLKSVFLFALFAFFASISADCVLAHTFGSGANSFDIEFVRIGNPRNAADTTGSPNPAGSVAYNYNIGKYEISRDMVIKANNAGGLGITLQDMTSFGGNGVNRPATGVSWNEAARFINWLNTSTGRQPAYKFAIQPGEAGYNSNANIQLWTPSDAGYQPYNHFRNYLARYFLPSVHEWYKAAYYDPNANGGAGGYWDYPTGSDTPPTAVSSGTLAGTAVFGMFGPVGGPADITQAGGLSPYGIMGMAGNAAELEETEYDLVNDSPAGRRGERGGSWNFSSGAFLSSTRTYASEASANEVESGFRVAIVIVPEPGTLVLAAIFGLAAMQLKRARHV